MGYNEGQGEIFFFHFNNRNLVRDAEKLESLMPQTLKKTWRFIRRSIKAVGKARENEKLK